MSIMIPSMIFEAFGLGNTCFLEDSLMTDDEKVNCEAMINSFTAFEALFDTIESENEYKGLEIELDLEKLTGIVFLLFLTFGYWKEDKNSCDNDEESYEWKISRKIAFKKLQEILKKMNAHIIKIEDNKILVSPTPSELSRNILIETSKPIIKVARFLPKIGSRGKKIQNITHGAYIVYLLQHFGTNIANDIARMKKSRVPIESYFEIESWEI